MSTPSRNTSGPAIHLVSQETHDLTVEDESLDEELWTASFITEFRRSPYPWEVEEYRALCECIDIRPSHCLLTPFT